MIDLISLLPIISLVWYFNFIKNNNLNSVLTSLIFFSFFMFATNYRHYGLEIDIYRYLHRAIGILVSLAVIWHVLKNRVIIYQEKPILILVFFLSTLLLSYLSNDLNMDYYIYYVRNFVFIALIVSYLIFEVNTNSKIEELFKLILSLTLILSLGVVYEITSISEGISLNWGIRASIFYSNPNYLAFALLPGFVVSIFSDTKYKWVMMILIIFAILATGSRSVQLAVIAIMIIFLFYKKLSIKFLISSLVSLILFIYLALFTSFPIISEIVINVNNDKSRIAIAHLTMNIFEKNPVNGIGYGQFRTKYADYFDQDIKNLGVKSINDMASTHHESMTDEELLSKGYYRNMEAMTHNDLMTIIAEIGTIGIVFLIYIFYKLYFEFRQLLFYDRRYFYISLSLIISTLTFSMFHNNLTSFIFWFNILLPFIINRNYEINKE